MKHEKRKDRASGRNGLRTHGQVAQRLRRSVCRMTVVFTAVMAAAAGTPAAQAQSRERAEWLAPLVDAFNAFAGQFAEIGFGYVNVTDRQLERIQGATCEVLATGHGAESVGRAVASLNPGTLQGELRELPEGSWRGDGFAEFLAYEDDLLEGEGVSDAARKLSMHLMIVHRERVEGSEPGRLLGDIFSDDGLSPERVAGTVDLVCSSRVDRRDPIKRAMWVWDLGKLVGGLAVVGINAVIAPGLPAVAVKSAVIGGVIAYSGLEQIVDL